MFTANRQRIIALTMIIFFLSGCASATVIRSNPPGAKLYVDGQFKGETPYTYVDRSAAGTARTVRLEKQGYEDLSGSIKREKLSIPALIGTIFVIIPVIWILEYPPEHTFEMKKKK